MSEFSRLILLLVLLPLLISSAYAKKAKEKEKDPNQPVVAYDARSLIINGSRELLFSGSIHYPRSTPDVRNYMHACSKFLVKKIGCDVRNSRINYLFFLQMWPDLIKKAKECGLNVIQTYVFWNIHEPVQGKVCTFFKGHFSFFFLKCLDFIFSFIFCWCSSILKGTMICWSTSNC